MSTALVPFEDMEKMATSVAASKLFGINNKDQAVALMLLCQAEGLHPAIAARDYHIIQGRPALKADAMLARFQQAGGSVKWETYSDEQVTGIFSHPQGGSLEVTWTLAKAKLIGIANKDNWKNYSRAMLRARCVSEGIRSVYPGCVVGVYTPEEVQDFTPPREVQASVPQTPVEIIKEVVKQQLDAEWPLFVPNLEEAHSAHHTPEEWIEAYKGLVERINVSAKLKVQEKTDKIMSLYVCNQMVVDKFSAHQRILLRSAIAQAGVDPATHIPTDAETIDL